MKSNKKWQIQNNFQFSALNFQKDPQSELQNLINILLENRGLKTKKKQEEFLHPDITKVTSRSVGIDGKQLQKTIKRIHEAREKKEHIIIFGDYDVDGICGTAILWETLHALNANAVPYIPSRVEEGYGLSIAGIENVLKQNPQVSLIITVDNGIVASTAVDFANSKGIDVIITDHHVASSVLPKSYATVHTTQLCGTGVAWMLSKEIKNVILGSEATPESRLEGKDSGQARMTGLDNDHLALVAMATVADLVPLTGANRIVLSEGLKVLHTTKRIGIRALCEEAAVDQKTIGVYEIGHILGPRLNAMGRIASAMDSLRLLCTKDGMRAKALAEKLGITNRERQELTKNLSDHALHIAQGKQEKLLFIAQENYEEGIIGLVAGRLVEAYYRPAIVLSIGEKISKASARSISGFNIIEFIRSASHLLINAGGHPMAAGFTVYTEKIKELELFFSKHIQTVLPDAVLSRKIHIDCMLPLRYISQALYDVLQQLQPFGMGNPEPTFATPAKILSLRQVGKDKSHLSLRLAPVIARKETTRQSHGRLPREQMFARNDAFSAIYFGNGDRFHELTVGDTVEIAYVIDENAWLAHRSLDEVGNDKKSLQLKIKDIKKN